MLNFIDLGFSPYQKTWLMQKTMHAERLNNAIRDTVLLVEHEPVYTLGKNGDENHVLQNHPDDVKVFHVERGGDVTFHGPGQLVGYPILDLHHYRKSVSWYMSMLEQVIMETLGIFNIESCRKEGLTGVWVKENKIAALGVRMSRWITMHGFALNVNTDLEYFEGIIPCGIFEYGVTSMAKELKKPVPMEQVKKVLILKFENLFKKEYQ